MPGGEDLTELETTSKGPEAPLAQGHHLIEIETMAEDGIVWMKEIPEETVETIGETTETRGIGETETTEVTETGETTEMIEIDETIEMIEIDETIEMIEIEETIEMTEETEDEEFVVRLNCVTAPSTF